MQEGGGRKANDGLYDAIPVRPLSGHRAFRTDCFRMVSSARLAASRCGEGKRRAGNGIGFMCKRGIIRALTHISPLIA
jgi:hypothetical protein